ncbi:kinetochore complex Sim4 subunit Fta1-domain-containing protein [Thermoascus aurantiacus ATCC 26904]
MALSTPKHLLNTSWTLHRLSPLHHGKEFPTLLGDPTALRTYAERLRDLLAGDVLRGVQIGANTAPSDDALAKAGALRACRWETIPTWSWLYWRWRNGTGSGGGEQSSLLDVEDEELEDPDRLFHQQQQESIAAENAMGILVLLEYENVTYKAALLAGPDGYRDRGESTYLPLLMTRLPNSLRQTFISFLSTNFDTYCSQLRLPSTFLCAALEAYIAELISLPEGQSSLNNSTSRTILQDVMKEMQLTLSFSPSIAPALRSMDVNLPRESLASFVVDVSRPKTDLYGAEVQDRDQPSTPFLTSLCDYLDRHLAMKLDLNSFARRDGGPAHAAANEHVRVTKVACGAFVLGGEGRAKLVAGPATTAPGDDSLDLDSLDEDPESRRDRLVLRANESLLRALVRRAVGGVGERKT